MMVLKSKEEIKKYLNFLGPELIAKIESSKNIADVGCAEGALLNLLEKEFSKPKNNIFGFDISDKFIKQTRKRFTQVYRWNFESKKGPWKNFDIVFLFDVLEHTKSPSKFLQNLRFLIKRGGFLVLSTPNLDSFSLFVTGSKWYGFKDKSHRSFFNKTSLSRLLEKNGFRIIKVRTISSSGFSCYDKLISNFGLGGQILLMAKKIWAKLSAFTIWV